MADAVAEFEERLLAYAKPARYRRRPSSSAMLSISNGESNLEIDRHPLGYSLMAKDRGAERHALISSDELEVVQKYLVMQVAISVRAYARMGRFALSGDEADLTPGFTLETTETRTTLGWDADGRSHTAFFSPAGRFQAIRFSYYADASLEDLERAVADPLGRPIFTKP